jgi:TPR repeat protein
MPRGNQDMIPGNHATHDQWRAFKVIGISACCLAMSLLAFSLTGCKPAASVPEAAKPVDLAGTRAKAERGDAAAQKELGAIYAHGQVVKQDYAAAARWYRAAADQGHAGAQTALGELYEAGQGVPHDEAAAAEWYRRAAEQGHVGGQYSLAVLYVLGRGVPKDLTEAVKWYRRAAGQGNALARYNLGMRYKDGDGVPADLVEAYAWLSLASEQGLEDAAKARDELKRRMTREQVAEGQRRANTFGQGKP